MEDITLDGYIIPAITICKVLRAYEMPLDAERIDEIGFSGIADDFALDNALDAMEANGLAFKNARDQWVLTAKGKDFSDAN